MIALGRSITVVSGITILTLFSENTSAIILLLYLNIILCIFIYLDGAVLRHLRRRDDVQVPLAEVLRPRRDAVRSGPILLRMFTPHEADRAGKQARAKSETATRGEVKTGRERRRYTPIFRYVV